MEYVDSYPRRRSFPAWSVAGDANLMVVMFVLAIFWVINQAMQSRSCTC